MHHFSILIIFAVSSLFSLQCGSSVPAKRPNVLFISVDDLRPELNCYGSTQVYSPNIDKLAHSGTLFNRAYCNVPVCGASRSSLMTGIRPGYNRFLQYYAQADVEMPQATTLPEYFKQHGYQTISVGKVFHSPSDNEQKAWSETPYRFDHHKLPDGTWSDKGWQNYITQENLDIIEQRNGRPAMPWEQVDTHDSAYFDGKYANKAIEYLRSFQESDQPFFLGLGFLKPHLPFNAPQKYWDLYDREKINLAENPLFPAHAPKEAQFNWGELRAYHGIPGEGPVSDSVARTLVHGYYACISATDALIGKVLNELEQLGLKENTIIVLWGDHGYNLGEHGFWCKHVNFETSLRTTLMMAGPGCEPGKAEGIVELVDLYPTLVDICELPQPTHPLGGVSLVPMLKNPATRVKDCAISKWMNGVTLVDERYFYTEWHDKEKKQISRMLYDHQTDPEENNNIAENPAHDTLVNQLSKKLSQHLADDYWAPAQATYNR